MRILDLIDGFTSNTAPTVGTVGGVTPSATQSIAGGGTITENGGVIQLLRVQGNGGAQTASTTPFGTSAPSGTPIIILIGVNDTNTLTIQNNDSNYGCMINGDIVLNNGSVLGLIWMSTELRYKQLFRLDY